MNWYYDVLKKICRTIIHPKNFYFHRIAPKLRHNRFPRCHPSAIVNDPLKFNAIGVTLEEGVYIFKNARISCVTEYADEKYNPTLIIGANTSIQQNSHITCAKRVSIGKWCAITHNVTITDIDHSYEYSPSFTLPPPIRNKLICNNVSIGDFCMIFPNAVILGGTEMGERCVVAANAVVRGKFPPYSLIGGIPAKILKRYNPSSQKWERTNPNGSFIIN